MFTQTRCQLLLFKNEIREKTLVTKIINGNISEGPIFHKVLVI